MRFFRKILIPFVPLYYLVTYFRNYLYDIGWLKSKQYIIPIINVGNLSVGGTGKTPMIEYIISKLNTEFNIAVLSRGYKRQSKGFVLADSSTLVTDIGDEPFQFYSKYKSIHVAVDTNRQEGIDKLVDKVNPNLILLDDAFQHRKVSAGYNVLLTTYDTPFYDDIVLPTGNLREPRAGYKRAQSIIVTKCPKDITEDEKCNIVSKINPYHHQKVFFSWISYSNDVVSLKDSISLSSFSGNLFTLVTGIANPKPLKEHLNNNGLEFEHLNYSDHHNFTQKEIDLINTKNIILTTEKDFMRLKLVVKTKLYYIPIIFELDRKEVFISELKRYIYG